MLGPRCCGVAVTYEANWGRCRVGLWGAHHLTCTSVRGTGPGCSPVWTAWAGPPFCAHCGARDVPPIKKASWDWYPQGAQGARPTLFPSSPQPPLGARISSFVKGNEQSHPPWVGGRLEAPLGQDDGLCGPAALLPPGGACQGMTMVTLSTEGQR